MRYKRLARRGDYRLRLPSLDGGLNTAADPTAIEDNELADVCNLRCKDGALVTRPTLCGKAAVNLADVGVVAKGDVPFRRMDAIGTHPFEVDGEMCTLMLAADSWGTDGRYTASSRVLLVGMDGQVKASYTMPEEDELASAMVAVPVEAATYGAPFLLYHYGGVYRPNGNTIEPIPDEELYAPLVMINGTGREGVGQADGVMYEGFNLLTRRYRARFTTTVGETAHYESFMMPTTLLADTPIKVEVTTKDGVYTATLPGTASGAVPFTAPDGSVDDTHMLTAKVSGEISIHIPFAESPVANNVTITASMQNIRERLPYVTVGTWFGGAVNRQGGTRLFLAGSTGRHCARLMWSDVNNPLYFPENNFTYVGDLSQRITALDKQENMLVIFKEREMYYTTYVEGDVDADRILEGTNVDVTVLSAHFPITQLSPYIGCDCPRTVVSCRNRLVWMCADGRVYTLASASQYSERNVREIGQKIRPRILADTDPTVRRRAYAADYDGEYWLLCGKYAYTFRYDAAGFVNLSAYSSAKTAAKAIGWFVQAFDGFAADAATAIVSDGADRALIVDTRDVATEGGNTVYTHVRFIHTLDNGDGDRYVELAPTGSAMIQSTTSVPVHASLRTKAYAFGGTAFCRVKGLWITAKASGLQIGVDADNHETWLPVYLDSARMYTHFAPVGIKRCHRIALMLDTDAPVMLSAVEWCYTPFGFVK